MQSSLIRTRGLYHAGDVKDVKVNEAERHIVFVRNYEITYQSKEKYKIWFVIDSDQEGADSNSGLRHELSPETCYMISVACILICIIKWHSTFTIKYVELVWKNWNSRFPRPWPPFTDLWINRTSASQRFGNRITNSDGRYFDTKYRYLHQVVSYFDTEPAVFWVSVIY